MECLTFEELQKEFIMSKNKYLLQSKWPKLSWRILKHTPEILFIGQPHQHRLCQSSQQNFLQFLFTK